MEMPAGISLIEGAMFVLYYVKMQGNFGDSNAFGSKFILDSF